MHTCKSADIEGCLGGVGVVKDVCIGLTAGSRQAKVVDIYLYI